MPGARAGAPAPVRPAVTRGARMRFTQAHRLDAAGRIDRLAPRSAGSRPCSGTPNFHAGAEQFARASAALVTRQAALAAAEEEWLTLEALREDAEG